MRIGAISAPLLVALLMAGCGTPTPAAPPTAKEVLAKPGHSNLKDAHFNVSGTVTDNGVAVNLAGDGALMYQPKPAGQIKFQTTVGGQSVAFEEISIDGTNYGLAPGATKWIASKTGSALDPSAFVGATNQKYLGEIDLPQGKAWHASAVDKDGNAFEAFIRERDSYPIKYVETQSGGQNIILTFDRYNTGATITPPPAAQVQQG